MAVAGVGLAAVGVGSYFGAQAIEKLNASNANGHCDGKGECDEFGYRIRSDGRQAGVASTVFFVAGGAALAGGAVFWFTAPKGLRESKTGLAVGPGSIGVVGRW